MRKYVIDGMEIYSNLDFKRRKRSYLKELFRVIAWPVIHRLKIISENAQMSKAVIIREK